MRAIPQATDTAGSTRLWQAHHEVMVTAYARHDTLLREAITSHGGMVYKVIGDALQVAFATAPNAVSAALPAEVRRQVCPSRATFNIGGYQITIRSSGARYSASPSSMSKAS